MNSCHVRSASEHVLHSQLIHDSVVESMCACFEKDHRARSVSASFVVSHKHRNPLHSKHRLARSVGRQVHQSSLLRAHFRHLANRNPKQQPLSKTQRHDQRCCSTSCLLANLLLSRLCCIQPLPKSHFLYSLSLGVFFVLAYFKVAISLLGFFLESLPAYSFFPRSHFLYSHFLRSHFLYGHFRTSLHSTCHLLANIFPSCPFFQDSTTSVCCAL